MTQNYKAAKELLRVAKLSAFSVKGAYASKRLNQHATIHYFDDASVLQINATTSRGNAWSKQWKGTHDDTALRPLQGIGLRINK